MTPNTNIQCVKRISNQDVWKQFHSVSSPLNQGHIPSPWKKNGSTPGTYRGKLVSSGSAHSNEMV